MCVYSPAWLTTTAVDAYAVTIGDVHENRELLSAAATATVNVNVTGGGVGGGNMELTKVCRLCLAAADWPVSVFDELAAKIAQCLQIRISSTDQLPKNVCVKCKDTVNEFHAYYTNTVECQKQLNQLVDIQSNMVRIRCVTRRILAWQISAVRKSDPLLAYLFII